MHGESDMQSPVIRFSGRGVVFLLLLLAAFLPGCSDSHDEQAGSTSSAAWEAARMANMAPKRSVSTSEALLLAAERGDTETVKLLLEAGVKPDVAAPDGATALIRAARAGHTEIVKLLLDAQAEINATDKGGTTALMGAAAAGHIDVVKALIGAGADKSLRSQEGMTAYTLSQHYGHMAIAQLLAPPLPAPAATQEARVRQLQRLLAALGYDPGIADGIWGPKTAAALHAYQQDADLPVGDAISDALIEHAESTLRERRASRQPTAPGG
jgi:hypothetical protein